jgi:hypothetical protein
MSVATSLELDLPPTWSAIQPVWAPCHDALRRGGLAEDEAYSLSMVTRELLENAVKYGDAGSPRPIHLSIQLTPAEVTIEVKNRVTADDTELTRFDRAIQWLRGFQDPFEAYVERLKLVSAESYRGGQSGLGLARIAYEAKCLVDFYVDEESTLSVSAVYARPGAPGTA